MASRMGDQTARLEGRITLNPQRHIDIVGTLVYPGLMIFGPLIGFTWFGRGDIIMGWGKPTPVITRNLKRITRDDNIITLAGPAANLLLAILAFAFLWVLILVVPGGAAAVDVTLHQQILVGGASAQQALALLGMLAIEINLGLIFFNMLPVPPLDASRFVRNLLPYNALNTYDQIASFGFILIFFLGGILVRIFLGPSMGIVRGILAAYLERG